MRATPIRELLPAAFGPEHNTACIRRGRGSLKGVGMEQARKERLKAYALLVVFVALVMTYGRVSAQLLRDLMETSLPAAPLIIGAVLVSLGTIAPLVVTFRPEAAPDLLRKMRERARRFGKTVTMETAGRSLSMYVVAVAVTPMLYGLALIFLIGEFFAMLLLLPATVILAVVGWFVLGRLLREMSTMFLQ